LPALAYDKETFIFSCAFADRGLAKDAGFRWDSERKIWYTTDLAVAARLREYAIGFAKTKLNQTIIEISPWTKPLPLPPEGYEYLPHQIEAINFALSRNRSYLGLDPGLGKTICAAIIAQVLARQTVYISPPFLVQNVVEEFKRWSPSLKVAIFKASAGNIRTYDAYDVLIVPDSVLNREVTLARIKAFIKERGLLFIDEAHRFKNPEAQRTQSLLGAKKVLGIVDLFERQVYLSGTPMPNRPVELYPLLSKVAPECIDFMSYFDYGRRYCGGHRNEYGWDFTGASNVKELAVRVIAPNGPFMLRQKKHLLNLPPKLEEVFVVSDDMPPRLASLDSKLGDAYANIEDLIKKRLTVENGLLGEDLHIATYRRLLGVEKAGAIIDYIKALIAETDESLIIFGYHKDVIKKLSDELASFKPFVITGDVAVDKRQDIVKEFQASKDRRIIIGNYVAMGIGFTLTKATRVIFCEFDWVPGVNQQAADRAHRIGQRSSVLVQYVAFKDSIDKAVIETLLRKQRSINHI